MTSANKLKPNQSMMMQQQRRHFQQLQNSTLQCYNQVLPNVICRSPGTVNNNPYEHKQQPQSQQQHYKTRNTNYSKPTNDDDTKSAENRNMHRNRTRNINIHNQTIEEDLNDMEMTFLFGHSSNEDLANDISQIDITQELHFENIHKANGAHPASASPNNPKKQNNGNNVNNKPATKTKSKKKRSKSSKARKHSKSDDGFAYEPHPKHRARGNIQISKQLTEEIIPSLIQQRIGNLYSFMDKLSAMRYFPDSHRHGTSNSNWGNIEIFNYGFVHKDEQMKNEQVKDARNNEGNSTSNTSNNTKSVLFAVAEHQDINHHKSRGYGLKMINRLFTESELMNKYNLNFHDLPISIYDTNKYKSMLNDEWKIKSILMDMTSRTNLIKQCQWHKINIFKRINNKRRMTLSCTKPEFIIKVINFSNKLSQGINNEMNLIPIILFNENDRDFVIEWCWIIRIEWNPNIDIAVSLRFDDHNNCAKIKSIHLDKDYLLEQHQMASPNHDCHCFDHFNSYIDDLAVGNPDDLKNKINYYLQVIDDLKQYKQDMEKLKEIPSDDIQGFQSLQHEMRGKLKPNKQISNSPKISHTNNMNMNMNMTNNLNAHSHSPSFSAHSVSPSFTAHCQHVSAHSPSSPIRRGIAMNVNVNINNTNKNMYYSSVPGSTEMVPVQNTPNNNAHNTVNHKLSLPQMMVNGNGHYPSNNNNRSMSLSPMFRQNSTLYLPSPNAQSNRSISPNASNTTIISPMYSTNTQFHIN